ncbi:MAG: hypothetical protein CVT63_01600 [Candidatus Anoxymicrobium japonicum]|uniref:Uncharacterized protein n=1 Tax=Candidatus Anoxymicrobium japonicum TaxID=2013648 RepID=A0A2N3G7R8_9ACTN|nr:MAG: hypothetical protein CVT63_01600 [Candidatus Anoxymicrobium japonicum]
MPHPIIFRVLVGLTVVLVLVSLIGGYATAAPPPGGKVVVLVIDRIGAADITLETTPFLDALASEWSSALMTTHTAERETGNEPDVGAEYVSLGAGVRSRGSRIAGLSFDAGELLAGGALAASRYFKERTGADAPDGAVVCPGISSVIRNNEDAGNAENVGLLSSTLAAGGKRVSVAGNADAGRSVTRLAPMIACNDQGIVPRGRVEGFMTTSMPVRGGYETDMAHLMAVSEKLLENSDVLVIDTGDTGRLDRMSANMDPDVLARARRAALSRADMFARGFAGLIDMNSSLLLVVSPGATREARLNGDYATPFIASGKGFRKGLLKSSGTARPGIVNNTDFLPTILDFFGIGAPSKVIGAVMKTAEKAPAGKTNLAYIQNLDRQFGVTRKARWFVIPGFLIGMTLFFLLGLFYLLFPGGARWDEPLARFLKPASVVVAAAPLSFLLISAFSYNSALFAIIFCALYALAAGLGAYFLTRKNERLDPVTLVCLFSASVMVVDLFFGGGFFVFPLLGSSSLDGMRFFGMNNAACGMMIAYALWGIAGLAGDVIKNSRRTRLAVLAGLATVSFVVGNGRLGANLGGFIAAAATALIFFFAVSPSGFKGWRVPAVALGTLAATSTMVLVDALFIHTHAGHAIAGGTRRVFPMVNRKVFILFSQIDSVLYPALLLVVLMVALSLWMKRPSSIWQERWKSDTAWTGALFAIATGSVVALLFNDTGLAMMGTMVMITAPVAIYHLVRTTPAC